MTNLKIFSMNEFIGIDFGTLHFRTGINRSGKYETIKNYYDEHEFQLIPFSDRSRVNQNNSIPGLCGIKQVFCIDMKNPQLQQNVNISLGNLFKSIYHEVCVNLNSEAVNGVITVPSYYHDRERSGLIALAEKAGFNQVRLIDENVALALGHEIKRSYRSILIFSLGAGPFSCTSLIYENGSYRTLNTSFNSDITGTCFESEIVKIICSRIGLQFQTLTREELLSLFHVAIKIKEELSDNKEYTLDLGMALRSGYFINRTIPDNSEIVITRKDFEESIAGFIDDTIRLSKQTLNPGGNKTKEGPDLLLMAGGSVNIPLVRKMITDSFSSEMVLADKYATVRGAALFASSLPIPPVRIKQPEKQDQKPKEVVTVAETGNTKSNYAAVWVRNYADDLEAYHKLWIEEDYSESIKKMEQVREHVTKYIAELCCNAGIKLMEKGLNEQALELLKKGLNYNPADTLMMENFRKCMIQLLNDSIKNSDLQAALKLLNTGLSYDQGNKEWRKLQANLRNMPRNRHNHSRK